MQPMSPPRSSAAPTMERTHPTFVIIVSRLGTNGVKGMKKAPILGCGSGGMTMAVALGPRVFNVNTFDFPEFHRNLRPFQRSAHALCYLIRRATTVLNHFYKWVCGQFEKNTFQSNIQELTPIFSRVNFTLKLRSPSWSARK